MKKKLLFIALCGALALGVTGCSVAEDVGDMVSDAGQAVSQVIDGANDMVSDAVDGTESTVSGGDNNNQSEPIETADQAVNALMSGNNAYLSGGASMNVSGDRRTDLAENGQHPHTVVITCSDSRVPPELVFNSSLGDLFVIRTAGNVVGDYEIGSVEYAADHLGSPLVVVMGHSECGAVGAAVEGHATGNIESIVTEITPSVEAAKAQGATEDEVASVAEDLNVENTIDKLMQSETLSQLVSEGKLTIKGAKYDIHTGRVTFFNDKNDTGTGTNNNTSSDTTADLASQAE